MAGARAIFKLTEVDRGWDRLRALAEIYSQKDSHAKVGVLDNEKGREKRADNLTQAMLALVMEFGTSKIPARSFVRSTFDKKRDELVSMAAILVRKIYEGKMTVERALGLMGAKFSSDIKRAVTGGEQIPPPNAPATLRKKEGLTRKGSRGSVRTLIDTGRMIGAVTWQVIVARK